MVWSATETCWKEFIVEARKRWGRLTDDDVTECKGDRTILVGKLRKLYNLSDEVAQQEIDRIESMAEETCKGAQHMR